jgi:hypothetical protein
MAGGAECAHRNLAHRFQRVAIHFDDLICAGNANEQSAVRLILALAPERAGAGPMVRRLCIRLPVGLKRATRGPPGFIPGICRPAIFRIADYQCTASGIDGCRGETVRSFPAHVGAVEKACAGWMSRAKKPSP